MNSTSTVHLCPLSVRDFHPNRGWICTLLNIPGARITELRMGGVTIPLERLSVSAPYIRFIMPPEHGVQAADVAVAVPSMCTRGLSVPVTVALITLLGVVFASVMDYARGSSPKLPQEQSLANCRGPLPVQHDAALSKELHNLSARPNRIP